jgi:hypothetical protein
MKVYSAGRPNSCTYPSDHDIGKHKRPTLGAISQLDRYIPFGVVVKALKSAVFSHGGGSLSEGASRL